MPDIAASVIAKLKNKAKESGKTLQVHMQLFCQEEFLRRVSLSKYADNLVLKGGLFIYTLTNFESRATDVIIPKAEKHIIPVQLSEFSAPEISTYSLESTIAEKFDAILQRLEMTSRMKDFYDIWYLANTFNFEGRKLQEAIEQTLQNRGTTYSRDSLKSIIAFATDDGMQIKWRQFLNRLKLSQLDFGDVLNTIQVFFFPVWQAIITEDEYFKNWNAKECKWY